MKIEINEKFSYALDRLENTSEHFFITGKAGTGKSTLLKYFIETTRKEVAVLAPTGVAAVNIGGQTLHSFFGFRPDVTFDKIKKIRNEDIREMYEVVETIIIDEVSMLRADILDCVDKFLRLNCKGNKPFGGKQMVFFGDLYQLPPVVTSKDKALFSDIYDSPYFFSAKAMEDIKIEIIELEKIYRQKDNVFIDLLNAIRANEISDNHVNLLKSRCFPDKEAKIDEMILTLTARNEQANEINRRQLELLPGRKRVFYAEIEGNFDEGSYPTEESLGLKKGTKVMLLNNDSSSRWINGTMGLVVDFEKNDDDVDILVKLETGKTVRVRPYVWNMYRYEYDKTNGKLTSHEIGSFTQYPLRLAWAITIHKSQGKTYSSVILDIGRGLFAPGQLYVALSRVTSIKGLYLKQMIEKKHIFVDWKVVKYLTGRSYAESEKKTPFDEKVEIIQNAIDNNSKLKIVYLKPNNQKSERIVIPEYIGDMYFQGKMFIGFEAYCLMRKDTRNFRVDRILEIEKVED